LDSSFLALVRAVVVIHAAAGALSSNIKGRAF
jgi:hypothetical protein